MTEELIFEAKDCHDETLPETEGKSYSLESGLVSAAKSHKQQDGRTKDSQDAGYAEVFNVGSNKFDAKNFLELAYKEVEEATRGKGSSKAGTTAITSLSTHGAVHWGSRADSLCVALFLKDGELKFEVLNDPVESGFFGNNGGFFRTNRESEANKGSIKWDDLLTKFDCDNPDDVRVITMSDGLFPKQKVISKEDINAYIADAIGLDIPDLSLQVSRDRLSNNLDDIKSKNSKKYKINPYNWPSFYREQKTRKTLEKFDSANAAVKQFNEEVDKIKESEEFYESEVYQNLDVKIYMKKIIASLAEDGVQNAADIKPEEFLSKARGAILGIEEYANYRGSGHPYLDDGTVFFSKRPPKGQVVLASVFDGASSGGFKSQQLANLAMNAVKNFAKNFFQSLAQEKKVQVQKVQVQEVQEKEAQMQKAQEKEAQMQKAQEKEAQMQKAQEKEAQMQKAQEKEAQVQSGLATKIEQKLMEYKDLDPKKDLTYLDKEKKSAWQEGKRMHLGNDKEKFVQPYIDLVDSLDAIKQHKASDDGKSFIEVLNDPLNNDDEKLQTSLTENGFDLSLKEAYESAIKEVKELGLHNISGHAIHH